MKQLEELYKNINRKSIEKMWNGLDGQLLREKYICKFDKNNAKIIICGKQKMS